MDSACELVSVGQCVKEAIKLETIERGEAIEVESEPFPVFL